MGHLHHHDPAEENPEQAQATLNEMTGTLDETWRIDVASQHTRQAPTPAGEKTLHDVALQAARLN